jgi:hypothetical protein
VGGDGDGDEGVVRREGGGKREVRSLGVWERDVCGQEGRAVLVIMGGRG